MSIADDLLMAMDPVAFARVAGFEADDWQAGVLRSVAPRMLLNCSRQSGKSSVAAILALHAALYQPDSLVLVLSPSLRQSQELFLKAVRTYRALGRPIPASAESALRLELGNGSRLIALPGTEGRIRGYSAVRLLVVDEAARVPDELYMSLRPMLAVSGGRIAAMSTPWGKRGWWYREWTEGGSAWERVEIPASACPRISPTFLAEEQRALGPFWFKQEYGCQFAETTDQLFSYEDVTNAVSGAVLPLFGGSHV